MKILVTGGAGFIGSFLVDSLIEKKHQVVIIDNLSTGNLKNVNKKAVFYKKDILDKDLSNIIKKEKIELVFHLAAQINVRKSIINPIEDANTNILGTLNLLEACKNNKVKKIIFSSTGGAIYGETNNIPTPESNDKMPESPYGISKLTIENYLNFYKKTYGLNYSILRYSNVYGPRQNSKGEAGVIALFIKNILNNEQLSVFGDGNQTRDYVYVKDVVKANILAIDKDGIFNVSTSKETSVNELILKLNKLSKKENKKKNLPSIKGEIKRSCLDNSKIKKIGWFPEYDLEKGLKETYEYFSANN